MGNSVFEYKKYKAYASDQLKHGEQKKFADFLGCQPAFLSQVLRAEPNLSLEQGVRATEYFKHSQREADFFISLLQYERAGSKELQQYFANHIESQKKQHERIVSRVQKYPVFKSHIKETYYSTWKYSWVHVLTSIKAEDQVQFLSEKTKLPENQISEILDFLSANKLILKNNSGQWVPTSKKIHVQDDESQAPGHHRNFRLKAIENIDQNNSKDLHFSSYIAFSEDSAIKLKSLILQTIEDSEKIIAPSLEETTRVLCIDYFDPSRLN